MSKKRMFSQSIVESDIFLDMPLSAQALYFHLSMCADDYGFVSPRRVMRMVGANLDDLKILISKRYVLSFESGVVVIKHWHINNTVRDDRAHMTTYKSEYESLIFNEFGAYSEIEKVSQIAMELSESAKYKNTTPQIDLSTTDTPVKNPVSENDNQMTTEIRLDKIRLVTYMSTKADMKKMFYELISILGYSEKTLFTDARYSKLKKRLKSFSADDIKQAASAIANDDYMQGDNDNNKRYGTIDYLLRNDEKLEQWVNRAEPIDKKVSVSEMQKNMKVVL
jgi:hypothetical protein